MSGAEVGLRWVLGRLLSGAGVVLGVISLVWVLFELSPGDLCTAHDTGSLNEAEVAAMRHLYGCDLPAAARFVRQVVQALTLDFGVRPGTTGSVRALVLERLVATLALTGPALLLGVLGGFGVASISLRDGRLAQSLRVSGAIVWGVPPMLLALLLMVAALRLGWPPTCTMFDRVWPADPREAVLPILALALPLGAGHARFFREILRAELDRPYVLALRARGLGEGVILRRHVLRNALGPVIALLGLDLPWLFGGAVVVEKLFRWHGVGSLLAHAVLSQDETVVTASTMVITTAVVAGGTVARLAQALVDPRVRP